MNTDTIFEKLIETGMKPEQAKIIAEAQKNQESKNHYATKKDIETLNRNLTKGINKILIVLIIAIGLATAILGYLINIKMQLMISRIIPLIDSNNALLKILNKLIKI